MKRFGKRLREGSPRELFGRVADTVSARPLATIAIVGALTLAGLLLALQLKPSASTDSLVGKSSAASQATERFRSEFGDEAVVVLVRGDLQRTVLTEDVNQLVGLEGCLSGNVPAGAGWRSCRPSAASSRASSRRRWCTGPERS